MNELFLTLKFFGIFALIIGLVMMKNSETDNMDTVSALVIICGFTLALFSQVQQYVTEEKAKPRVIDRPPEQ